MIVEDNRRVQAKSAEWSKLKCELEVDEIGVQNIRCKNKNSSRWKFEFDHPNIIEEECVEYTNIIFYFVNMWEAIVNGHFVRIPRDLRDKIGTSR